MGNNRGNTKFKAIVVLAAACISFLAAYYSDDISRLWLGDDLQKMQQTSDVGDSSADVSGQAEQQKDESGRKDAGKKTADADTGVAAPQAHVLTESLQAMQEAKESDSGQEEDLQDHSGLFYFEKLDENKKQVYGEIYAAIVSRNERDLSTLDTELVGDLYQFVLWDHPEIFYSNAYNVVQQLIDDKVIKLTIQPVYQMTQEEADSNQAHIDRYLNTFNAALPGGLDTYGKIKFVYEYLIEQTEYELGCANSQNICSVFVNHKSVCAGYTKATQYLLRELGIPATVVHGSVNGEGHAWNLVWVDGSPYYLDTTWGDASYTVSGETPDFDASKVPPVSYDYFLITARELQMTHVIDHQEYYPPVTDTQYNYYRHEGLYFESCDEQMLQAAFDKAYAAGDKSLTVKCASGALLEEMKHTLLDEQGIFSYVRGLDKFYYNINDSMHTMTFWLE